MKKPSILHICSYYIGNKLYKNLFGKLDDLYYQTIYIPLKKEKFIGRNQFKSSSVQFLYTPILKPYHRYLYGLKIKTQLTNLEKQISLSNIELIHAHTLYSDGGTAYLLYQKYNIPYIISVRNTDYNIFYKYALHYRSFAHNILINAKEIIFISYAYKKHFFKKLPSQVVSLIEHKTKVIPNGIIDDFYSTSLGCCISPNNRLKVITVGSLDNNKNIKTIIKAISFLRKNIPVDLTIVGDGPLKEDLENYTRSLGLTNNVCFTGQVDSNTLITLLDQHHLFILVSFKETFGISYIEALARGLPIIYTKNEGVDGYFNNGEVGYSVNPRSITEILDAVGKIMTNYNELSRKTKEKAKEFSWNVILDKYIDLYNKTIRLRNSDDKKNME